MHIISTKICQAHTTVLTIALVDFCISFPLVKEEQEENKTICPPFAFFFFFLCDKKCY